MALLELSGLNAFYGSSQALFDVDLTVDAGEAVCIIGRNGAGKSSTFRRIMGLIGGRGTVRFDGVDVSSERTNSLARRGIAYVPEDRRIFPDLTVRENLLVGQLANRRNARRVDDVLDMVGMLKPLVHRRGGVLSGGEQQALAIARALMSRPQIILLDEPSEGLAPIIVAEIGVLISNLRAEENVTVLLAEHNREFALGLTDRAYVLNVGRMVFSDTCESLLADGEQIEQYLAV